MTAGLKLRPRFVQQKADARRRGIAFVLTFAEWLNVWAISGHLPERGRGRGKYCMARFQDKGPYAIGNVKIILNEENSSEKICSDETRAKYRARIISAETRAKIAASHIGKKASEETRRKMSKTAKRIKNTPESRAAVSAQMKGNKHAAGSQRTLEEKARLSIMFKGKVLHLSSQERQRRSEHAHRLNARRRHLKSKELPA